MANATSTLALVFGTAGGTLGYRQHLAAIAPWLRRFLPVSLLGGLIGSALLTHTSDKTFSKLVPFLILFATVLFLAQGIFRRFAGAHLDDGKHQTHRRIWVAIFFQFLVAIYGGYFGAGIGILMLASLGFIGLHNIHEMNTLKTLLGSLLQSRGREYQVVVCAGLIDWPRAGVMTIGALAKDIFSGSHFSQCIPQPRVRQIITVIGFVISCRDVLQRVSKAELWPGRKRSLQALSIFSESSDSRTHKFVFPIEAA